MSLREILTIQRNRKERSNKIFEKIYQRVLKRITHYAKYDRIDCDYNIPQLLYGLPSVDLKKCGDFIEKKLKTEGFIVYRYSDTYFIISWEQSAIDAQNKESKDTKKQEKIKQKMVQVEDKRREELMKYLAKDR
jgi:hypothetical protein